MMTMVRAPASFASRVAATVSCVAPLCEIVSTATSGSQREVLIAWMWLSVTTRASSPICNMEQAI
jgi:hypothetical protein